MHILGINAYHGNSSAALVSDGRLIAAVEEERFNRVKYAAGFPSAAIRYCLDAAGITLSEADHIAIPRNPWARLGTNLMYPLKMPSFARNSIASSIIRRIWRAHFSFLLSNRLRCFPRMVSVTSPAPCGEPERE